MGSPFKAVLLAQLLWLLASCSSQSTIADLESVETEDVKEPEIAQMDHQEVRQQYQDLLELVDDQYIKEQIQRRISGVHMLEADDVNSRPDAKARKGYYQEAIASYKDILEKYPNSPDNAEVLYQLAKAYDLEGQTKNALKMLERLAKHHPYYPQMPEAYFRMGDIYFNTSRYAKAEHAYRQTAESKNVKLFTNAHYMLAWSMYKQGGYDKAMQNFAIVMLELNDTSSGKLNNVEQALVKDTLHSMSLALINLGGAQAIMDVDRLVGQSFVWQIYQDLAEFYLEKSLYSDSAATYREYIKHHQQSARASRFHSRMIQVYLDGKFPKLALDEKEQYANLYGPNTDYFASFAKLQKPILKDLQVYYVELATHYHSQGQQALAKNKRSKKKEKHLAELGGKSLNKASDFYGRYLTSFAADKASPNLRYQKAESHFENQQFGQAALDYDVTAYIDNGKQEDKKLSEKRFVINPKSGYELANKSAYASIVAYQKRIEQLQQQKSEKSEISVVREASLTSMLKFSQVFHKDSRSTSVLTKASQQMFELNQYNRAVNMASNLIRTVKGVSPDLKKTAYGIIGQSYFKLAKYDLAKGSYILQRKLSKQNSSEYRNISKNIAASIYKKAETEKTAKQIQAAIETLLTVKKVAPNTNLRILAQYEAASLMLGEKQWDKAIVELTQLKAKFLKHKLSAEFPRKLAFAYESKKDWPQALNAYTYLFKKDPKADVRQEALFVAAGLAEKNKKFDLAITYYKDYARKYEQPFDNRMEARYHLALLYEKKKDYNRQLYWLRRVIAGDESGGEQRSERSQWLAAWSNAKYGDYFAWEYKRRKLRAPIDKSIARKNQYIVDAVARYEMASNYGILEFVSMSNYKMAELYDLFSVELNNAPIPKSATAEERVLYKQIFAQQAGPLEELATQGYQNNVELAWQGHFTSWIDKSFAQMRRLAPLRFDKTEVLARYGDEIR